MKTNLQPSSDFTLLSIPRAHSIGLNDLPEDILLMISKHVKASIGLDRYNQVIPFEERKIWKYKWRSVRKVNDVIADIHKAEHWLYTPPDNPYLNSLQSLAATNQKFYNICLPLMWTVSTMNWPVPKR